MKKVLFYIVWLFVCAILQPTLMQAIGICGISANLFLIVVVSAGLLRGKKEGVICGLIYGLIFDLLVGRMIGVNALIYMYMGFAVGVLGEKFFSNPGCMVAAGVTVAAAVASGLLYYLVCSMVWGNISLFTGVVRIVLPQALYSGFAALLLFSLIRAAMRMLNMRILA